MHGFAVTFSELKVNLMIRETCSSCSRIKYKPNITGTCKLKRLYEKLEFCFSKSVSPVLPKASIKDPQIWLV